MNEAEFTQWESEYSVGVTEVDVQNRELMDLINDLINCSLKNRTEVKKYTKKILSKAKLHVANNFAAEEKILAKTKYAKLADHKAEHKNLLAKLKNIRADLDNREVDVNYFTLSVSLKEWLLSHIILYDKNAKDFFMEVGKGSM